MIIELPEKFYYTTNNSKSSAYVEGEILYITGYVNFEDLMYTLTYTIYGYKRCRYCHKKLTPAERSLDHKYPRSWGGVSIPDNLRPCCVTCNQKKADMTYDQFEGWKRIEGCEEKQNYYKECHKKNYEITSKGDFILPSEWIEDYDITPFRYMDLSCLEEFKIDKVNEYYEKNHQYPHPIVVSSNSWLLKGKHVVYHAIEHGIKIVPAIVLRNVVVIKDTCD